MGLHLDPHGRPYVTGLIPGKPAAACGRIAVGDRLLAVGHEPTLGRSLSGVQELVAGEPGTTVRLRLQGRGGEYEVDLVRGVALAAQVSLQRRVWCRLKGGRPCS